MWARVVLLQKVLASRVEAFSPYSLAAPQSVPTGFSPAAVGFMIVTSASVPGGWSGAGEVAGVERAGAEVGGGVVDPAVSWGLPPPDRLATMMSTTTSTPMMPPAIAMAGPQPPPGCQPGTPGWPPNPACWPWPTPPGWPAPCQLAPAGWFWPNPPGWPPNPPPGWPPNPPGWPPNPPGCQGPCAAG